MNVQSSHHHFSSHNPSHVRITPLTSCKSMVGQVKSEIITPPKLFSITIPNQVSAPLMPIQVVNMVPCASLPPPTTSSTQHNERKLLKRPKLSSPTTESRKQASLMSHIQELQFSRSRRQRASRSRMRLFSGAHEQQKASTLAMQQAATRDHRTAQLPADSWVLVATGQTDQQRLLTQQAHTFLTHHPVSPKRPKRIAVVPLLRMNCTTSSEDTEQVPL